MPILDLLTRFAATKNATPARSPSRGSWPRSRYRLDPGTRNIDHLRENLGGLDVQLTAADLSALTPTSQAHSAPRTHERNADAGRGTGRVKDANMRIGILGSGLMGGKLGTIFAKAGHDVVFSYARSQRKLNRLAREAGSSATAGTPREAAEDADVLLLAVHWSRVNDVLKQAGDLAGKVLITCSMPMNASDTALVIAHTSSGAEALAKKTKRAKVVSAFGTVPSEVLFDVFDAKRRTRRRQSLLYCGNNDDAKNVVAQLIRDVGFEPIDAGPLRIARYLEPFTSRSHSSLMRATRVLSSRTGLSGSANRICRP